MNPESHIWGLPPWRSDVDLPLADLPSEAGLLVVGAGLTGLSAALHARRLVPKLPVVVVEGERAGAGASGRSGGLLLEDTAAGPLAGFENCLPGARELCERENIGCGLELNGCWEISHRRRGKVAPIDWVDDGEPLRCVRVVAGGTADPGRLVGGLARAAVRAGTVIRENCQVSRIDFSSPLLVHTAAGALRARKVLLATNAYSFDLSRLRREAAAFLAIAVATAPITDAAVRRIGLQERRPFYTEDLPYLWGRLTPENVLVMGSGLLPLERGVSIHTTAAALLFHGLERRIRGFHPALARVEFTHRWAGPICITRDHRPILRAHPKSPDVWIAAGYSGHGLAQALRMGRLAAERLLSQP